MNHRLPEDALIEALSTGDLVPETAPCQAASVGVSVGTAESREPGLARLADDAGAAEELLEIAVGPHHPSTHGVFRMDVVLDGERVVRLSPVFGYLHRNHEKLGESGHLSGGDAVHRPARLLLFADEQLGLRPGGRASGWPACARAGGVHPGDHGRTDAGVESRLSDRVSPAGVGGDGHADHVRVSRAREDSGSLRGADRVADDVQLPAFRRMPLRPPTGLAGGLPGGGGRSSAVPG